MHPQPTVITIEQTMGQVVGIQTTIYECVPLWSEFRKHLKWYKCKHVIYSENTSNTRHVLFVGLRLGCSWTCTSGVFDVNRCRFCTKWGRCYLGNKGGHTQAGDRAGGNV